MLAACSSLITQPLDTSVFYKRDLQVKINGQKYEGVVTVPRSETYNLEFTSNGNIDLAMLKTCHREDTIDPKKKSSFFGFNSKTTFYYNFQPRSGLEDGRTCPMTVDVYEAEKGRHAWAFIEFEHPNYNLPFDIDCNGSTHSVNGVFACQAKASLIQRIIFQAPVMFWPPEPSHCAIPEKRPGNAYEIKISEKECIYQFDTKSGQLGKLITIGYQGVKLPSGGV